MRRKKHVGVAPLVLAVCSPAVHDGTAYALPLEDEVPWVQPLHQNQTLEGDLKLLASTSDQLAGLNTALARVTHQLDTLPARGAEQAAAGLVLVVLGIVLQIAGPSTGDSH